MIIDAKDLILGRVATAAAKQAMLGEDVQIVNCEQAVITGNKKDILAEYIHRLGFGQPNQGPYHPRKSNLIFRKTIRGMLPWKRARGREAYARIRCYVGVPEALAGKETTQLERAKINKLPNLKFMKLSELCRLVGAKE
jgi:large subunit ribosomal protein L13